MVKTELQCISGFYKLKMYTVYVYEIIRKKGKKNQYMLKKTFTIYMKFLWGKKCYMYTVRTFKHVCVNQKKVRENKSLH